MDAGPSSGRKPGKRGSDKKGALPPRELRAVEASPSTTPDVRGLLGKRAEREAAADDPYELPPETESPAGRLKLKRPAPKPQQVANDSPSPAVAKPAVIDLTALPAAEIEATISELPPAKLAIVMERLLARHQSASPSGQAPKPTTPRKRVGAQQQAAGTSASPAAAPSPLDPSVSPSGRKKRRDALPQHVLQLVADFYLQHAKPGTSSARGGGSPQAAPSDDGSANDKASLKVSTSFRTLYESFRKAHPTLKLSYTKFLSLRPDHVQKQRGMSREEYRNYRRQQRAASAAPASAPASSAPPTAGGLAGSLLSYALDGILWMSEVIMSPLAKLAKGEAPFRIKQEPGVKQEPGSAGQEAASAGAEQGAPSSSS